MTGDTFSPKTVLQNRYELRRILGKGGMALVYSAFDLTLNREVAIKVLRDELILDKEAFKRFQREIKTAGSLVHENIITVFDAVKQKKESFIVMEQITGNNLKQEIEKKKKVNSFFSKDSIDEVVNTGIQTLKGLAYMHKRNIIHRDIKPSNLFITVDGKIKIGDLGIAKNLVDDKTLTHFSQILGSLNYMAPEQMEGKPADKRTDIYGLGATLYEYLTGEIAYGDVKDHGAFTRLDMIKGKLVDRSGKLKNLETHEELKNLTDIIRKALNPNPDKRYRSAEEMITDLSQYQKNKRVAVKGISWLDRKYSSKKVKKIKKWGFSLLALTLLSASVFIPYQISQNKKAKIEKKAQEQAYIQSTESTSDKIRLVKADNLNDLKPLLEEFYIKACNRLYFLLQKKIIPRKESSGSKESSYIYPYGTLSVSQSNPGEFAFLAGDALSSGYVPSILFYAFDEFEMLARNTVDSEKRDMFKQKSKEFFDEAFYYTSELYFSEYEKDPTNISDRIELVMTRFYPPLETILELEKKYPDLFSEKKKEIEQLKLNCAKATQLVLNRFDPELKCITRIIPSRKNNLSQVEGLRDLGVSELLCGAFRYLNLKDQVLSTYNNSKNQIQDVNDYLKLIIKDTDTKIEKLVKSTEWRKTATSNEYSELLLGLIHRTKLLKDINSTDIKEARRIVEKENNSFLKNLCEINSDLIPYLEKKSIEYDQLVQDMLSYFMPKLLTPGNSPYFLEKRKERDNNPRNNIPKIRGLEAMIYYGKSRIKNLDLNRSSCFVLKDLLVNEISGKNVLIASANNPDGFLKNTIIDIDWPVVYGGTYIGSDYRLFKVVRKIKKN